MQLNLSKRQETNMKNNSPLLPNSRLQQTPLLTAYLCAASMLLLATCGCKDPLRADYESLGLLSVSGKITLDEEPLANVVIFIEAEDGTHSYATTSSDGTYQMKFNSEVEGVLPGKKIVRISTTASTGEIPRYSVPENSDLDSEADPDVRPANNAKVELVPSAYNRRSVLSLDLNESTRSLNFDLKTDGSTTGPTL